MPQDATSKAIIAELLSTDVEMRELAKEFVRKAILGLINTMERGDPAVRARLYQSLAAPLTSAITEVGEDDGQASLKEDLEQMMAEMMEAWVPPQTDPPNPVTTPTSPHITPKS